MALGLLGCFNLGYLAPKRFAAGPDVDESSVRFRFHAPTARRVQLAGSWPGNNWARGDGSVGEANVGLMAKKAEAKLQAEYGKSWDEMFPQDEYYEMTHMKMPKAHLLLAESIVGEINELNSQRANTRAAEPQLC